MSSDRSIKEEYGFKERDLAEFMAFLYNSALYLDDKEDKYIVLDREQVNRQIKDAYEEGDYLKAESLLRTAKMISSAEIEEMLTEVTVRSLPFTFGKYLLIASRALQEDVSSEDIVRRDLCEEFDRIVRDELASGGVDKEKLDMLRERLDKWRDWPSEKPQMNIPYSWSWDSDSTPSLREAFHEYIRMKLAQECREENVPKEMIEFLIGRVRYSGPPFTLYESMTKSNDSIFFKVKIWGIFVFDELTAIKKELLKSTEVLQKKIEKYWQWDDAEEGLKEGRDDALIDYSVCPSVEVEVRLEEEKILFDGVEVSQDNEENLESLVFTKLSLSSLEYVNIGQTRKESEQALKKGDFSKAYELNKVLSGYKATQDLSTWLVENLLDELGHLEPVTLSIPRILSFMFDAFKKRIYGRLGIQQ